MWDVPLSHTPKRIHPRLENQDRFRARGRIAPRVRPIASIPDCEFSAMLRDPLDKVRSCASLRFLRGRARMQAGTVPRHLRRCDRSTGGVRPDWERLPEA